MEKIDLEKFNKDGYLIVDNVFSMKEMDLLNNVVKDILLYDKIFIEEKSIEKISERLS